MAGKRADAASAPRRRAGAGRHAGWIRRVLVAGSFGLMWATALTGCSLEPAIEPQATLDLPKEAWWGGPSYYRSFPRAAAAGWADPSFFPIAVFHGKPEDAAALWSIGVNTLMGAEHDGSSMSTITGTGMSVLAQLEWTAAEVGDDPLVVGWSISDECDMGYSECTDDEAAQLAKQRHYAETARGRHDGRFIQANFGNGVLGSFWSKDTMPQHLSLVDVSSVDKYAYTSPQVQSVLRQSPYWPGDRAPATAFAYGWLQDRMETFTSPAGSKPNWVFVETAMPYLTEQGATTISADQLEGAVWSAIIHGAAGIAYFQHNNNGDCGNYSLVACPVQRAAAQEINASVHALAPVLNTPSYTWSFGTGLRTALKSTNGYAYVLAMTDGSSGTRTFTLPPGIEGRSAEVVGEQRTIPITDHRFTDRFASEFTHHTYRIIM